ncbi:TetR family transcriptional regulator [Millisia brevis]|uniref:TetR family transcriptional regulator n=1 Tax=Millisia brevis TaxID=264148 RepID=UPI0008335F33|nr:TetR family transcriptional regulator [Millisia brevis]
MPKIVDHDAVRTGLADAAMRLLEQEGLPAISVRQVAREAGVTPGYLRHYYPTQVDLERALTIRTAMDARDRIAAILEWPGDGEPRDGNPEGRDSGAQSAGEDGAGVEGRGRYGRARIRASLAELLPLDRRRRLEVQVAYRFIISAGDLPEYGEDLALLVTGMRSMTRFAVTDMAGLDHEWNYMQPLADPDLENRAELLAELLDGISLYGMQTPSATADDLLARLDTALDWVADPLTPNA